MLAREKEKLNLVVVVLLFISWTENRELLK